MAIDSHGFEWRRGDGGDKEVFSKSGVIASISGVSLSKDTIDATHLGSPGKWEELISSTKRTGEITVEILVVPGSQAMADLIADVNSDQPRNYQFVAPPEIIDLEWTFLAFCTGFETGANVGELAKVTAKFKPTGQPGMIE